MGLMEYPEKVQGLLILLRALVIVVRTLPVKLMIAGDGRLSRLVDKEINELGLQDNVKRLGKVSDRVDFYLMSNLHCHISLKDVFPLVTLEALACGVNVLMNDLGDFKDIDFEGIHFCDPVPESIAESIIALLENPKNVDPAGIVNVMSWNRCAMRFQEFLE